MIKHRKNKTGENNHIHAHKHIDILYHICTSTKRPVLYLDLGGKSIETKVDNNKIDDIASLLSNISQSETPQTIWFRWCINTQCIFAYITKWIVTCSFFFASLLLWIFRFAANTECSLLSEKRKNKQKIRQSNSCRTFTIIDMLLTKLFSSNRLKITEITVVFVITWKLLTERRKFNNVIVSFIWTRPIWPDLVLLLFLSSSHELNELT